MQLSIIVVCYNMPVQINNTLQSLLPPYQRGLTLSDFEILLVDNGSPEPLADFPRSSNPNVRYHFIPAAEAKPSPAGAINQAVARAHSSRLCILIDGARLVTPGTVSWGLRLLESAPNSLVEIRGWHLGPAWQPESVSQGYDERSEHVLLEKIRWWENGYRLFEIAAPTPQVRAGLSVPAAESNCVFLERDLFERIGGFDERYAQPGGGFVNLDFYARAVGAAERVWTVLGEGTFHQVHGGAATGLSKERLQTALALWRRESEAIRGPMPLIDAAKFVLAGHLPEELLRWLCRNSLEPPDELGR
jgi:glycosyltransferase involved in cell wall biosynthesis